MKAIELLYRTREIAMLTTAYSDYNFPTGCLFSLNNSSAALMSTNRCSLPQNMVPQSDETE